MELKVGELVLLRNTEEEEWLPLRLEFKARGVYYAFAKPEHDILTDYLLCQPVPLGPIPLSEGSWPIGYTLIRLKSGEGDFRVVTGVNSIGVVATGYVITYRRLLELYEMSTNIGLSWEDCCVYEDKF